MDIPLLGFIPLIAAVISVITAIIVYRKEAAFHVNRRFSYLCLGIAIWDIGFFAQNLPGLEKERILLWIKISHFGAAVAIPLGLHFIIRFTRVTGKIYMVLLGLSYAASSVVVPLLFTGSLMVMDVKGYTYGSFEVWGPLYPIYFLNIVCSYSLMLCILVRTIHKATSNIELNRVRYIFYGTLIVVCTSMTNFLPAFGYDVFGLGHFGILIFMVLVIFGIYKVRLMNIRLAIAKYVLLAVFWLVMGLMYSGVLYGLSRLLPAQSIEEYQILFNFIIIGIFAVLFQLGTRYFLPWIEKLVYPLKSDLKKLLQILDRRISAAVTGKEVAVSLLEVTYGSLNVPTAAIYLRNPQRGVFELIRVKGKKTGERLTQLKSGFKITTCHDVIIKEELKREVEMENFQTFSREVFEILINEMEMLNIEVAIPLISENQFVGLLGFGRKRLRGVYDMEDVSALKLLSGRAADAILNFETVDKLRERETLALIGEMTAGIAHEIKNPLGAIKGAADNLTGTSFPKDIRKFSTIITEESSRLDRIVKQFLIYARPAEASIEEADLVRLTQRCRELFLSESKADAFSVRVTGTEDSIMALVDPDFFKQVFYNIAGNSFEAKQDGTIQLSVTQNHGQAEVKFSDNCGGMVRDIADKVFNPFFTTKHEGTGLGMAIVKKLVRLMNGNIYINTRLKQGTDIILVFPQKAEARRGA